MTHKLSVKLPQQLLHINKIATEQNLYVFDDKNLMQDRLQHASLFFSLMRQNQSLFDYHCTKNRPLISCIELHSRHAD
jgi:hypothetical protein